MLYRSLAAGLMLALTANSPMPRVEVALDRSAADAALAIIEADSEPSDAAFASLTGSRPYVRLHERENAMKRPFTDAEFLTYLRSPELRANSATLRSALHAWQPELIATAAATAFAYLPEEASLRATIYPMIKIRPNTFVWDLRGDPAIFYAIDPTETQAEFATTLAHELHHIGFGAACASDAAERPDGIGLLRGWVGAFNEGLAVLAAAGGPDHHPRAGGSAAYRAEWDTELTKVPAYMKQQEELFRSVLSGTAGPEAEVDKAMFAYFGEAQGPWYTVGYSMAATIEREMGREAVIDAFCQSHTLLETYNRAADQRNRRAGDTLPKWNSQLATALAAS